MLLIQIKSAAAVSLVWTLTIDVFPLWEVQVYSFAEREQWIVLNFVMIDV